MSRALLPHTGDAANSVVSRSQIGRVLADRLAEDDGVRDLACLEGNARFMGDVMRLNPHLQFDGQCEAAFKLYEQCLGGKIVMMMTYANHL
jgi:hypothetical protein